MKKFLLLSFILLYSTLPLLAKSSIEVIQIDHPKLKERFKLEDTARALGFEQGTFLAQKIEREKKVIMGEKVKEKKKIVQITRYGSCSIMGQTGLIDIPNTAVVPRGAFNLSSHFIRFRESKRTFLSHKVNYGLMEGMEVGAAIVELEDDPGYSAVFNTKYRFTDNEDEKIKFAAGYQYVGSGTYDLPGQHNLYGVMGVEVADYMKLFMNAVYSTGRWESMTFNVGIELLVKNTPVHSSSVILEWEQDSNQKYNRLNFGLRYRMSEILNIDLFRLQNFNSSDDSSGMGMTLRF